MPESDIRYTIDAHDVIEAVSDSWYPSAVRQDGEELANASVIGRSLWDFITDKATREIYRKMIARVRQGRQTQFTLRCDGPTDRRLLSMTVTRRALGAIEFETKVLQSERREAVPLLMHDVPRSSEMLTICAWCNLVDIGDGAASEWVEVEVAMERLRLFERDQMPQLSHSICDACLVKMMADVETPPDMSPEPAPL
jgi:hypothetical protein